MTHGHEVALFIAMLAVICGCDSDDDDSDSVGEDDFDFDDDSDDDVGDDDDTAGDDDSTGNDDVDDDFDDDIDDDNDFDIEGSWEEDTWPDAATGLTWQTTNIGPSNGWEDAKGLCEAQDLGGYDDWRLPSISELRTIIRGSEETETGGDCPVTDECSDWVDCYGSATCDGGFPMEGPTQGCYWTGELSGKCHRHWSSVAVEGPEFEAWAVWFSNGGIEPGLWDEENHFVRCVRG